MWCGSETPVRRIAWCSGHGSYTSARPGLVNVTCIRVGTEVFSATSALPVLEHLRLLLQVCSVHARRYRYVELCPAPRCRKLELDVALLYSAENFLFYVFLKHNVPSWAG